MCPFAYVFASIASFLSFAFCINAVPSRRIFLCLQFAEATGCVQILKYSAALARANEKAYCSMHYEVIGLSAWFKFWLKVQFHANNRNSRARLLFGVSPYEHFTILSDR